MTRVPVGWVNKMGKQDHTICGSGLGAVQAKRRQRAVGWAGCQALRDPTPHPALGPQ